MDLSERKSKDKPPDYVVRAMRNHTGASVYMGWLWRDGKPIKRVVVSR